MPTETSADPADPRRWGWRRLAVFVSVLNCFAILALAVWRGGDSNVGIATVNAITGLLGVLVVAYVFAPSLESAWALAAGLLGKKEDRA